MNPLLIVGLVVAAVLGLVAARRAGPKASLPLPPAPVPPPPPPPPPPTPPSPAVRPVASAPVAPYITAPADVVAPASWSKVGAADLSSEPLRDRKTGGYAHLTYAGALTAARALGAELPSREDLDALADAAKAAGTELAPVILPDGALSRSVGIDPANAAAVNAFRNANMTGEAWARIHDERVRAQLVARRWDGKGPVANAGKHWIAGAPPRRSYLKGWRVGQKFIQTGPSKPGTDEGPHDDRHHDYGTTTVLKRSSVA